jgi:hypothetical protein
MRGVGSTASTQGRHVATSAVVVAAPTSSGFNFVQVLVAVCFAFLLGALFALISVVRFMRGVYFALMHGYSNLHNYGAILMLCVSVCTSFTLRCGCSHTRACNTSFELHGASFSPPIEM